MVSRDYSNMQNVCIDRVYAETATCPLSLTVGKELFLTKD